MHRADIAGLGVRVALTERCIRHFEGCNRNCHSPGKTIVSSTSRAIITGINAQAALRSPK